MGRGNGKLIFCLAVVLIPLAAVLVTDTTPKLGLDLQGGISVVLAPVEEAPDDSLEVAVDIMRERVDSLGVAEPELSRQGDNITVDLPGVDNRDQALRLVGSTGELRFRPVLQVLPPEGAELPTPLVTTTTAAPGDASTTTTSAGGAGTSTTVQEGRVAGAAEDETTTTTAETTSTTAGGAEGATTTTTAAPLETNPDSTERADDDPEATVVLPVRDFDDDDGREPERLRLGPAELLGEAVDTARADFQGQWSVLVEFTGEGADGFNDLAAKYVGQQVAIVLDSVVQSYPTIQQSSFPEGIAVITGDFSQGEAQDLARLLRYGALPVALEQETVQSISPTLGRDQLRTGIIAGIGGLALVMGYMVFYYRLLGLVIWGGLLLSAAALYALTCWLGQSIDLTLTLAGVTGIVVSVGYTVDSYVVYFERLKDEVRSGKTVRSSVDRGFAKSFKTIMTGNLVSLIGAGLLYALAIGSVRGFALFLGLSTLLDIFVAYFFMHPVVTMVARSPRAARGKWLGVGAGLGVKGAPA
ncbi:MAG: protein translocase subunit SecD [Acidimicrobiia bacterium]